MTSGIFLIQDSGKLVRMDEAAYDSEDLLQALLEDYPDLLAGDQMESSDPRRWLLVRREMGVPGKQDGSDRWSVDHLFLDQDAIPTLVEVKRSSDTRIRREVVGQMLDYAANAVAYWPVEHLRLHFERQCESKQRDADQVLGEFLGEGADVEEFWQKAKTNLQAGKIRMVFVADVIPNELKRIVEFLNEQMDPAQVLAVEIKQYVGEGLQSLVPRVIGQTAEAEQKKSVRSRARNNWSEDQFFEEVEEVAPSLLERQKDLLQRLRTIQGLDPRFDGTGKSATYKVWLTEANANVLWIYAKGDVYVRWGSLKSVLGDAAATSYRELWRTLASVDQPNGEPRADGANVNGGLESVMPEQIAKLLGLFVKKS